ncbi:MAG TPA: hypothetical protein PKD64_15585 [Pirellulaceae bacterium]|nr:hypothetical protein [Pirellulaceae bacterium]HMO93608.1 hypothetical protein [Pirellulaceae bacterium]HMP70480.1 hypothetical protein [Pirellulaceae bacterium]
MSWVPYSGSRGGRGWQNTTTGEVRYVEGRPGGVSKSQAVGFSSPNVLENQSFEQAMKSLSGERHKWYRRKSDEVDSSVGVTFKSFSIIGDWGNSAKDRVLTLYTDYQDYDELRYVMAWKGLIAKQYSVLLFEQQENGRQSIYQFDVDDKIENVRETLEKHGVKERSLERVENDKIRVYIVDLESKYRDGTRKVAEAYNVKIEEINGTGEFIGVESNQSRREARDIYEQLIREYEQRWPNRKRYKDKEPRRLGLGEWDSQRHAFNRPLIIGIGLKE